jgi:hypothetical protein
MSGQLAIGKSLCGVNCPYAKKIAAQLIKERRKTVRRNTARATGKGKPCSHYGVAVGLPLNVFKCIKCGEIYKG